MNKLTINYFIDIMLTYLIFFVLFYSWINFYRKSMLASFVLASLLAFFVVFLLFYVKAKKDNKKNLSFKQREKITNSITQLKFLPTQKLIDYFYQNISKTEKAKKHCYFVETDSKVIYPFFAKTTLDADSFTQIYTKFCAYHKEIVILCENVAKDTSNLANLIQNKKITIFDAENTYNQFVKKYQTIPESVIFSKPKKLALKELFCYMIQKERTRNYFLMGLVLIVSSFFVLFKIYYLIVGSILLCMALLTRLLPYFKKQKR